MKKTKQIYWVKLLKIPIEKKAQIEKNLAKIIGDSWTAKIITLLEGCGK